MIITYNADNTGTNKVYNRYTTGIQSAMRFVHDFTFMHATL